MKTLVIHTNEKRLGRVLNKNQFSCVMFKATPEHRRSEKPQLLFELEMRYCIKCNAQHWFIGDKIEFEQTEFNPKEYWTWQLEEMGFFDKAHDTTAPND